MTDKHIRFAWALQCENRGIQCITIPLHILFCFNGLCFGVHGESSLYRAQTKLFRERSRDLEVLLSWKVGFRRVLRWRKEHVTVSRKFCRRIKPVCMGMSVIFPLSEA